MRDVAAETTAEALLLQMNPRVSAEFTGNDARALHAIEHETGKWFHFEGSEGLPLEHFAVLLEGDREQVLERALPFREGEEVHVELVEPHMYSPGDAVAKIDGYIIAVKDADRFVGEKRLVRIEEVGRTAAVARLVDGVGGTESAPAPAAKPKAPARSSSRRKPRAEAAKAAPAADGAAAAVQTPPADVEELDTDNVAAEIASSQPVDADAEPAEADDDEDGLESKPRRRGRRGGRRRSGARAETPASATPSSE
jgi:ribonuclease G